VLNIPRTLRISTRIPPDAEGFFGRECPSCERQFRVYMADARAFEGDALFCPYCGTHAPTDQYWTKEQIAYARSHARRQFHQRLHRELERFAKGLEFRGPLLSMTTQVKGTPPSVRPLVERSFKRAVACERCGARFTVYGLAYYCPFCGLRGPFGVLAENLNALRRQLRLPHTLRALVPPEHQDALHEMAESGAFEQILDDCLENAVTAFETCWKQATHLVVNPNGDPDRRAKLSKRIANCYQNVERGRELALEQLGTDIFAPLSQAEYQRLDELFQCRHVVTHNSGIIDEKFAQATGRPSSDVGTRLRIEESGIEELLDLVERVALDGSMRLNLSAPAPRLLQAAGGSEGGLMERERQHLSPRAQRKRQVRDAIMAVLYAAQHSEDPDDSRSEEDLQTVCGATDAEVDRALDYLSKSGLVQRRSSHRAALKWEGVWYCEESAIGDSRIRSQNEETRTAILRACGELLDYTTERSVHYSKVIETAGVSEKDFRLNVEWLTSHSGYLEFHGGAMLALTVQGEDELDTMA
jgi:hypothetical protein